MSGKFVGASRRFRRSFEFAHKGVAHYFPGHMTKGLNQMNHKLKDVDAIIEVHDARIPFSGRNQTMSFDETIKLRPHMLVLNKVDLADFSQREQMESRLEEQGIKHVLYTNCKEQVNKTVKTKLIPAVLNMMEGVPRYHRTDAEDYNLMIIGVPNVGKSSLINALRRTHLRKGKATRVGGMPGITRSVLEKIRISDNPRIYVFDSPGILAPNLVDMEVAMKLALCATLKDHLVGEDIIVDYMLYWLNKHEQFQYVEHFKMEEPTDSIYKLLSHVAAVNRIVVKHRSHTGGYVYRPHFIRAAQMVLSDFREGLLGKMNLDRVVISDDKLNDSHIS